MNQLRWDPTLKEWVAYATHRQDRTFFPPAEYCPLCPTKPGGFPTEVPRESYEIAAFENKGEAIGVTLHHPHGQVYAYPFIPPRPAKELRAAGEYRSGNGGRCLHCDLLSQEHEDGRRLIAKGEPLAVLRPFPLRGARLRPPLRSLHSGLERGERRDLARVLKRLLVGYDRLFGFSLPYMMVMHQAPTDGEDYAGVAHFHVEFFGGCAIALVQNGESDALAQDVQRVFEEHGFEEPAFYEFVPAAGAEVVR